MVLYCCGSGYYIFAAYRIKITHNLKDGLPLHRKVLKIKLIYTLYFFLFLANNGDTTQGIRVLFKQIPTLYLSTTLILNPPPTNKTFALSSPR